MVGQLVAGADGVGIKLIFKMGRFYQRRPIDIANCVIRDEMMLSWLARSL